MEEELQEQRRDFAKLDTALVYTEQFLDKLSLGEESQGVFNVSRAFAKKAQGKIEEGIEEALERYKRGHFFHISRWRKHSRTLFEAIEEGWDLLLVRREARALTKTLEEMKKIREKPPELPSRYEFIQKGPTPMQEASVARELYAKEKERGKNLFKKALEKALNLPYRGSRVSSCVSVVSQAARCDLELAKELIASIDLQDREARDGAVLAALRLCSYETIREAVEIAKLLVEEEARDGAYEFLFDLCYKEDQKMAMKIAAKVVKQKKRHLLLARMASFFAGKSDIAQAKELRDRIGDEEVREMLSGLIEHHEWQNFVRRKSEELPPSSKVEKEVSGRKIRG